MPIKVQKALCLSKSCMLAPIRITLGAWGRLGGTWGEGRGSLPRPHQPEMANQESEPSREVWPFVQVSGWFL